MNKKLEIIPTIVDGVQIGLKNFSFPSNCVNLVCLDSMGTIH